MDADELSAGGPTPPGPAGPGGKRRRRALLLPIGVAAAVAAIAVAMVAGRGMSDDDGGDAAAPPAAGPIHNGDTVAASGKVRVSPDGAVEFCPDTISDLVGHGPGWVNTACPRGIPVSGVDVAALSDIQTSKDGYTVGQAHLEGTWRDRAITVTRQGPPTTEPFERRDQRPPCSAPPGGWREAPRDEDALTDLRDYLIAHPDEYSGFWVTYPRLGPSAVVDPTAGPDATQLNLQVITVGAVGDLAADQQALAKIYPDNLCLTKAPHSAAELNRARSLFMPHLGDGVNSIGTGFDRHRINLMVVSVSVDYIDDTIWQLMQEAGPDLLDVRAWLTKASATR